MTKRNKLSSLVLAIFMTFSIFLGGCSESNTVSTNKNIDNKTKVEAQKLEEQKKKDEEDQKNKEEKKNKLSELNLIEEKVKRVVDGDTIELENGKKVRLIGINTPESTTKHEPYGKEASNYTKSELEGKTVYLEKDVSETDRYGRLLRYVWINIPKDKSEEEIKKNMFNALLALNGFAQQSTYPPDVKYQNYFGKYAAEARKNNKGLWAIDSNGTTKGDNNKSNIGLKSKTNNSSTKKKKSTNALNKSNNKTTVIQPKKDISQQNKKEIMVWLSATGSKYHNRSNCGRMNPNTATKVTLKEAERQGYAPCKKCF